MSKRAIAVLVVVLVAGLGVLGCFCDGFNADELQHLHAAWLVSQGFTPYRDYFDHHPPLYHLLFAPLVRLVGRNPWALLAAARLAATSAAALTLLLFARIAAPGRGPRAAAAAVVLVVASRPVELLFLLRPDPLAVLAAMAATWLLIRRPRPSAAAAALAGLLVGAGLMMTQKVAALAPAYVLWLACRAWRQPLGSRSSGAAGIGVFIAAVCLPVGGVLAWLAHRGALAGFLAQPIGFANQYHTRIDRLADFQEPVLVAYLALALGIAWCLRALYRTFRREDETYPGDLLLALLVLIGMAGYFRSPAPSMQAYLLTMHVWLVAAGFRCALWLTDPDHVLGRVEGRVLLAGAAVALLSLKPHNMAAAVAVWGAVALVLRWAARRAGGRLSLRPLYAAMLTVPLLVYSGTSVDRVVRRPVRGQMASMQTMDRLMPPGTAAVTTWPILTPCRPHATFHWFSDIGMYTSVADRELQREYLHAMAAPTTSLVVADPVVWRRKAPEVLSELDRAWVEAPLPPAGLAGARAYVRRRTGIGSRERAAGSAIARHPSAQADGCMEGRQGRWRGQALTP